MRILIVEDSLTEAKVLKFALEKQGHETFVAGSAEEALEQLKFDNFPIVISDWGIARTARCRTVPGDSRAAQPSLHLRDHVNEPQFETACRRGPGCRRRTTI